MIGIYKITSPSGKVYIGQSWDIEKRFKQYIGLYNCKKQTRLYNSFMKYKVNTHQFNVIEECETNLLNERERYWQEYYNVLSNKGLNCLLVKTDILPRIVSEETKRKIGEKSKGRIHSEETKQKRIKSMTGLKRSPEFCKKMSDLSKGRKASEKTKEKQRLNNLGKKLSLEAKQKLRNANFQKEYTLLLNLETGIYYNSICELARALNYISCIKLHYILTNKKSAIKLKNIIYV
jgi:group I intron endonuclease